MWRWTRQIASLYLAVRFGYLVLIALIAASIAEFGTLNLILIVIVMVVLIFVHLTQWRRRRDE